MGYQEDLLAKMNKIKGESTQATPKNTTDNVYDSQLEAKMNQIKGIVTPAPKQYANHGAMAQQAHSNIQRPTSTTSMTDYLKNGGKININDTTSLAQLAREQGVSQQQINQAQANSTPTIQHPELVKEMTPPSLIGTTGDVLSTLGKSAVSGSAKLIDAGKMGVDYLTLNDSTIIKPSNLMNYANGKTDPMSQSAYYKLRNLAEQRDDIQLKNLYNAITNGTFQGTEEDIKKILDKSQKYQHEEFYNQWVQPSVDKLEEQIQESSALKGANYEQGLRNIGSIGEVIIPTTLTGGAGAAAPITLGVGGAVQGETKMQQYMEQGKDYSEASKNVPIETAKGLLFGTVFKAFNPSLQVGITQNPSTLGEAAKNLLIAFRNGAVVGGIANTGVQMLDLLKEEPNFEYINWDKVEQGIKDGKYADLDDYLNSRDFTNDWLSSRNSQTFWAGVFSGGFNAASQVPSTMKVIKDIVSDKLNAPKQLEADLKILGLEKGATPQEVRKAAHLLQKKYHSDLTGTSANDAKFQEINEAYNRVQRFQDKTANSFINRVKQWFSNIGKKTPTTYTQPTQVSNVAVASDQALVPYTGNAVNTANLVGAANQVVNTPIQETSTINPTQGGALTTQNAQQTANLPQQTNNVDIKQPMEYNGTDKAQYATVAPYRANNVTEATIDQSREAVEKQFVDNANGIANALGIEITNTSNNMGGFMSQEGPYKGQAVNELSYTFELGNATPEQADMFARLLGDLGNEVQEAVISANYVGDNDPTGNALEIDVTVKDLQGVKEALEKAGIEDYTIDRTNNKIKLLSFDGSTMENELDKLVDALGGNYGEIEKAKINSRYIGREARRDAYKEGLSTIENNEQNRELRNYLSKALEAVENDLKNDDQNITENSNKGSFLMQKYPNINLNENISQMDGIPAVELEDGSILPITSNDTHIEFIKKNGLDVNDIKSGGWIGNGVYEASYRSDTDKYVEQEKAKQRVVQKHKERQQQNNMLPTTNELKEFENQQTAKEPIVEMETNTPGQSYNLSNGLDKFYSGSYGENDSIVILDETPEYFYNLGYDLKNPIVINMQKLKSVTAEPKGTFNGINQHGITRDLLEQLPNALQNPLNVIKNPKFHNRFVVVTELTDQYGDIVIVPIEMNTKGYIEGIYTDVNRVVSTYGKEKYDLIKEGNDKSYIELNKDNIVYDIDEAKKIRNSTANPNPGLQLSNAENASVSINNSIPPFTPPVNPPSGTPPTEPPDDEPVDKIAELLKERPAKARMTKKEIAENAYKTLVNKGYFVDKLADTSGNQELKYKYDRMLSATNEGNYVVGEKQTDNQGNVIGKSVNDIWKPVEEAGKVEEFSDYLLHKLNINRMSLENMDELIKAETEFSDFVKENPDISKLSPAQIKKIAEGTKKLEDGKVRKANPNWRDNITSNPNVKPTELQEKAKKYLELDRKVGVLENRRNKPVFGKTVTADDSRLKVAEYEKNNPEFKEWSKDINTFNKNQLQNMVDAGLTNEETQDLLNNMYDNYIRIQREVGGDRPIVNQKGHLKVNSPIKKAKGGNQDILPLKDSMAQQAVEVKKAISRNLFGQELLDTIGGGEETPDYTEILKEGKNGEAPTFTVFKDGKPVTMKINKELYDALKPAERETWEDSVILHGLQKGVVLQKTLLTSRNPIFALTNFVRDLQTAVVNSKDTGKMLGNYAKLVKYKLNDFISNKTGKPLSPQDEEMGRLWELYKANGGESNTYFDFDKGTNLERPKNLKGFLGNQIDRIFEINEIIEQLPRVAEFATTLQNGGTIDEAMYNAADVTVNFKRGGEFTKMLDRNGASFLNASVQGIDKQIRNFTNIKNGGKGWAKMAITCAMLGIAPQLVNHLLLHDDEDYQDLPDYIKDNYWLFKIGDNKFIRIPRGRDIPTFLGTLAQRTSRAIEGDDRAFDGIVDTFQNTLAPNNPFDSNIYEPIDAAIRTNKAWNGSDIVSTTLENKVPSEQYDAKDTEFAKWLAGTKLGKKLKLSPKKIDYLIDQYSGGIGDILIPLNTKYAEGNNPLSAKFSTDSINNNKQLSRFYDDKTELSQKKTSGIATDKEQYQYKYLNDVGDEISDLNKQIREIEMSDMKDKDKIKQVTELRDQINTLAREANKNVDKYGETANDYSDDIYEDIFDSELYKNARDKEEFEKKIRNKVSTDANTKAKETLGDKNGAFKLNTTIEELDDAGIPLADYYLSWYAANNLAQGSTYASKQKAIRDYTDLTPEQEETLFEIFNIQYKKGSK